MSLFRIRREVMAVLDAYAREAFHQRMFLEMHERHPAVCEQLGGDDVRAQIQAGIDKAIGYGIHDERFIESFLDLLFERGFDFDVHTPWARRILDNTSLVGATKVRLLLDMAD